MIERLPDDALEAAERALSGVAESTVSLRASLEHAEINDEPLTDDDLAAIDRGWRSLKEGRGIPDDELDARLAAG